MQSPLVIKPAGAGDVVRDGKTLRMLEKHGFIEEPEPMFRPVPAYWGRGYAYVNNVEGKEMPQGYRIVFCDGCFFPFVFTDPDVPPQIAFLRHIKGLMEKLNPENRPWCLAYQGGLRHTLRLSKAGRALPLVAVNLLNGTPVAELKTLLTQALAQAHEMDARRANTKIADLELKACRHALVADVLASSLSTRNHLGVDTVGWINSNVIELHKRKAEKYRAAAHKLKYPE